MKKIMTLAAIIFLFWALPSLAEVCGTQPPAKDRSGERGLPLEFTNDSDSDIASICISETGRNIWSKNLLDEPPLKNGEDSCLNIKRESILGLTDIKIIYSSGKERIWKKLPILEIFEITNKKDGEPDYERIKLGT